MPWQRGEHTIEYQLVFPSSRGYVFHDSRGFEAGATGEVDTVRDFIRKRVARENLDEQLHAIWKEMSLSANNFEADIREI